MRSRQANADDSEAYFASEDSDSNFSPCTRHCPRASARRRRSFTSHHGKPLTSKITNTVFMLSRCVCCSPARRPRGSPTCLCQAMKMELNGSRNTLCRIPFGITEQEPAWCGLCPRYSRLVRSRRVDPHRHATRPVRQSATLNGAPLSHAHTHACTHRQRSCQTYM